MKKVLLVTNIPAPYRVDLFYYLQTHVKQYEFYVMYCAKEADNRCLMHLKKREKLQFALLEVGLYSIRRILNRSLHF